jgi:hypothetical protein
MGLDKIALKLGDRGPQVGELQLRLSGFEGSVWDGGFGPGTERQVKRFQRDVMRMRVPTGIFDVATFDALQDFTSRFPVDFTNVRCPCGKCGGFGQNQFAGQYRKGMPQVEAYHEREYPGIHKGILHAYRAACFYLVEAGLPPPFLTSGYRCWIDNDQNGRKSTNHMGKALDLDFPRLKGEDANDDAKRCDLARSILEASGLFQVGWTKRNTKSLEPANLAPTWIHMDVRSYSSRYLADEHFTNDREEA